MHVFDPITRLRNFYTSGLEESAMGKEIFSETGDTNRNGRDLGYKVLWKNSLHLFSKLAEAGRSSAFRKLMNITK